MRGSQGERERLFAGPSSDAKADGKPRGEAGAGEAERREGTKKSPSKEGEALLKRSASSGGSKRVCLICLEEVTSEDLRTGKGIVLDCECKGDVALRHTQCATKWASVKGSLEVNERKNEPPLSLRLASDAPRYRFSLSATSAKRRSRTSQRWRTSHLRSSTSP